MHLEKDLDNPRPLVSSFCTVLSAPSFQISLVRVEVNIDTILAGALTIG